MLVSTVADSSFVSFALLSGSSSDCVAARRLLMHVTLSTSCLRLSALSSPEMLTGGTELPTSTSVFVFIILGQFLLSYFFALIVLVCYCGVVFLMLDVKS